jgi:hypothetical protein
MGSLRIALGHPPPLCNQVDEHADIRGQHQYNDPYGFHPSRNVRTSEKIRKDCNAKIVTTSIRKFEKVKPPWKSIAPSLLLRLRDHAFRSGTSTHLTSYACNVGVALLD